MFEFLDEQDDTPFFKALAEKGEGRLHQQALASAWGKTKFGRSLCQIGGRLTGPALGEWMILMSKVNPKWTNLNAKNGRAKLQEKLDSDPYFYQDWITAKSEGAKKFKEEYPILFEEYQKIRVQASMQWRLDNPEEHAKNFANFQTKGQARAKELECWRIGWEVAHKRYKEWQQTEDYLRWKKERSEWLSYKRNNDPEFNAANAEAGRNSKKKQKSDRKNIKLANEATHQLVECPKCKKLGDKPVMERHHFDKCTFDLSKELEIINNITNDRIFSNSKELKSIFEASNLQGKTYFTKYDILSRYFKKLFPDKKTSGKYVKKEFNTSSYFQEMEDEEVKRKEKIKSERIKRAKLLKGHSSPNRIKAIKPGCAVEVTCPHCGKTGKKSGMKSWHFDHCKDNPNRVLRNGRNS